MRGGRGLERGGGGRGRGLPVGARLFGLRLELCRHRGFEPLDLGFELFLLEEMLPDALAGGQEGYCVCTLQVATCFLRQLQLPPSPRLCCGLYQLHAENR